MTLGIKKTGRSATLYTSASTAGMIDYFSEFKYLSLLKREQSFFFENTVPLKMISKNQTNSKKPFNNPIQGRSY